MPSDVWAHLPPATQNTITASSHPTPAPAPTPSGPPAGMPSDVWAHLTPEQQSAITAQNNGAYTPPRPPPPQPSMTTPVPGVSAQTWQHLPVQERQDMLAEYQAGQKVVSEPPDLKPLTNAPDSLLDLHRGDWHSPKEANNPVAALHDFLTTNGYLDPKLAGGPNHGLGTYYGQRTKEAVMEFQRDQGLKPTGVIDQATLSAMQSPGPVMDRKLRGPAGTYASEVGDPVGKSQTLANGSVVQSFENGKIVRDASGKVTAYGADGWPISLSDIASKFGATPEAKAALAWSADQMIDDGGSGTGINTNVKNAQGEPLSTKDAGEGMWNSWCLAFVASAYGRNVPELEAADAAHSMQKFAAQDRLVNDRTNIPPGAPVFFQPTSHNSGYGHIAIFTGKYDENGDPLIRTTGWRGFDGISEIPLSKLEAKTGAFAGWGVVVPP
ncbi:MAG TPA: peptidoglycan-binding domain-containing protein [Myxococcales bacterium]|nr:peptidoglycan-binding domain-containing protein [Myxococcales bacterium]